MRADSFTPLTAVIAQISKSYGFEMKMLESRLKRDWAQIVGPHLATHTWPDSIKFKKLYLVAENSVWLQQLVFLKPALLEKIHERSQGCLISDIVLRVGEIPVTVDSKAEHDHARSSHVTASTTDLSSARALTCGIRNPELRRILTQVIAKALSISKLSSPRAHLRRN